jgi:hypothetical protein
MSVVGAAVQADSAATAQDPRHAGRPAGDGDQDEAQRRQVPGLSGNRRPEGEGQAQARLCPWVRLLQTRRASDLHGTRFVFTFSYCFLCFCVIDIGCVSLNW